MLVEITKKTGLAQIQYFVQNLVIYLIYSKITDYLLG